uniref:RRM domain-containing protein n=1 Tax=Chenopodium quinoa TaxID=63459 RepID=A0A803ME55_CHEQI
MSHFGRAGPPDIRDTYSLLVLNITFRTTADDLYPLFDRYGKVVDVFIPRDRRTGESRGFAFVRYKYQDEAAKAVEKLDGKVVDGREIMVQFAKYGPNAEKIQKGRILEPVKTKGRSRSPRPRHRDDHRDRDYRRRSRSRSRDRSDRDRYRSRDKDYRRRSSRSYSRSPDHRKDDGKGRYDDERRSRSRSYGSASPRRASPSPRRSPSPRASPKDESPNGRAQEERSPAPRSASPRGRSAPRSASPRGRPADSRSQSPRKSDVDRARCSSCLRDRNTFVRSIIPAYAAVGSCFYAYFPADYTGSCEPVAVDDRLIGSSFVDRMNDAEMLLAAPDLLPCILRLMTKFLHLIPSLISAINLE